MFKKDKIEPPSPDYRQLLIDLCRAENREMFETFAGDELLHVKVSNPGSPIIAHPYPKGYKMPSPYKIIYDQIMYNNSIKDVRVV